MKIRPTAVFCAAILAIIVSLLSGCDIVTGNGNLTSKEISIPQDFKGAKTTTSIDIVVDPSLSDKAVLEGESNIIDLVDVSDQNGLMVVDFKRITVSPSRSVKLRIPYFNGGSLETSSSGSIKIIGSKPLKGEKFNLRTSSSGSINVALEAKEMYARSSSSGNITVKGSADKAVIELSSSGGFSGFDCRLQDASVQLSSSGSAKVNVSGKLTGSASSSGNIIYDGNPSTINIDNDKVKKR